MQMYQFESRAYRHGPFADPERGHGQEGGPLVPRPSSHQVVQNIVQVPLLGHIIFFIFSHFCNTFPPQEFILCVRSTALSPTAILSQATKQSGKCRYRRESRPWRACTGRQNELYSRFVSCFFASSPSLPWQHGTRQQSWYISGTMRK